MQGATLRFALTNGGKCRVRLQSRFYCNMRIDSRQIVVGAQNCSRTRETFFRVGDFRTGLSEDRDWCIRARSMGYLPTFSSDLAVMHVALDDVKRLRARWARVARETHAFHRFHGAGRSGGLLYCLTVAASPLVHGWRLFGAKAASAPASIRWRTLLLLIRIRSQRAAIAASLLVRDLLNAVRDALSGASKAGP